MFLDPARRARWGLLVLVALVGSLLLGASVPVAGADRDAENPAVYSACVGPAIDPAGFTDVARYPAAAEAAINCLAHYGITQGTATGDFDPDGEVTRWQMALFLVRAAGPAGIVVPHPSNQGFRDIGGLAGYIRVAINQLADLEITKGTTKSSFSPHSVVTRRQMAQFLARFLEAAPVGPGGVDIEDVELEEEEYFEDLKDLRRDVHGVIATLFEMGVTTGTSSTRFSPDDPVTRAQMALFITRALAHTNARPSGLTLQTADETATAGDKAELGISVRDSNHRPVPDTPVDLFHASSRKEVFDSQGRCSGRVSAQSGDLPCAIDVDDETTDEDGNVIYEVFVDEDLDEDLILWAWAGDQYDEFDLDTTPYVSVEFSTVKAATHFLLTDDLHPEADKVPYGRSVTFSLRLVDEDEEPVAQEGVEIEIRTEEERDGTARGRRTHIYFTDSAGEVQFTYHIRDPGSRANHDDTYLTIGVLDSSNLRIIDKSAVGVVGDDQRAQDRLPWSSEDKAPNAVVLELPTEYHPATDTGRGARNRVIATLVDQYGEPVRGKLIHFRSGDMNGLWQDPDDANLAKPTHREGTNVRGEATERYYRDGADPGIETITAFVEDEQGVPQAEIDHYWVREAPTGRTLSDYEVKVHDEDRNTLVVEKSGDGPYLVVYDSNDQYDLLGEAEKLKTFKESIEKGDLVDIRVQSHAPDAVNSFERKQ